VKRIYKIVLALIVFLILGITGIFNACKKNEKTIVDYYNTLPKSFFYDKDLGDVKYPLINKKGKWFSKSLAGYDLFPIVDLKKGYIKINDEGTGGGNALIELFLFKKPNGNPIIAITKGGFDGFYFDSHTHFYTLNKNTWVAIKKGLPKLVISRFLNKDYRNLSLEKDGLINQNLTLLVRLNRDMSTAIVKPNFDKYDFLIEYHLNTLTQNPFNDKAYDEIVEIVKNISIESFQLRFNKQIGKFEIKDSTLINRKKVNIKAFNQDVVFDKLSKLKVVKELALYIDSASQKKRSLKLIFEGENKDNPNYVTFKAVEDNGSNFVTHLTFRVQKDNLEISLYKPIADEYVKIRQ